MKDQGPPINIATIRDIEEALEPIIRKVVSDEIAHLGLDRLLDLRQRNEYVCKQDAAKTLGCSTSSIDNYRRRGILKGYPQNGSNKIWFLKSDVLGLIEDKT